MKDIERIEQTEQSINQPNDSPKMSIAVVDASSSAPAKEPFLDKKRKYLLIVMCVIGVLIIWNLLYALNRFQMISAFCSGNEGRSTVLGRITFDKLSMLFLIFSALSIAVYVAMAVYMKKSKSMSAYFILCIISCILRVLSNENAFNSVTIYLWMNGVLVAVEFVLLLRNIISKKGMLRKQYWLIALSIYASISFNIGGLLAQKGNVALATIINFMASFTRMSMVLYWFLKKNSDIPVATFADIVDKGMGDDGLFDE
jgi:hypothetical protein